MLAAIFTLMAVAAACMWLVRHLQNTSFSPLLSAIPNAHFSAPYSRYWLIWLKGTDNEHKARHAAHKRLGPVIRIAPQELSINCVENGVQPIYGGSFEKAAWYLNFFNYGLPFMFAMGPNKPHSERKRMISHVYSNSYIQTSTELKEIIRTMIHERLLPQMREWAKKGMPINIHKENKAFVMDITTAYFFGLGNGTNFITDPKEKDLLSNFELGMSGLFWFAEVPFWTNLAGRFGIKLVADGVLQSYGIMEDLCVKMCAGAKQSLLSGGPTPNSHPTVYAQLRQKLTESGVPDDALETTVAAEMLDHVQAGHEGTGITLTYLMCELSRNPDAKRKLRKELESLGVDPSPQAIDSLPFLDAVLMETMRRYPGSLGPFPRYVPEKGARLGGFEVPAGTTVSTSVYSLHRNPEVFPMPEEWRPERWLEATVEGRKEMMRWFWVFGSGGRMCIGNHLAIRMMKAFTVAVYSEFDTLIVDETRVEQVDGLMAAPVGNVVMLGLKEIELK